MVRTETSSSAASAAAVVRPRVCNSSRMDISRLARMPAYFAIGNLAVGDTFRGNPGGRTRPRPFPRQEPMTDTDGRHDFDFLYGTWHVTHRQLVASGGDEWRSYDSRCECRGHAGGLVNVDELNTDNRPLGVTVRCF